MNQQFSPTSIPVDQFHIQNEFLTKFESEDLNRQFPHIAKGSFGVVYKGNAKGFDQIVVIKDLTIQNQNTIEEWKKEISLMRY
jgi:hypothetical protein